MKMAKASEADLDMALELIGVLDDIERGYFPHRFSAPESESTEWLDTDDLEQYDRLIDNLRRLLNRGSIGRVIMGMAVICDPANECIDPDASTIELHPKLIEAEQAIETLERIKQWCEAYPLSIFPEPDWDKVRQGLESVGITVDSVSASNMRHVVTGIKNLIDSNNNPEASCGAQAETAKNEGGA